MKKIVALLGALAMLTALSACHECKHLTSQVLQPTSAAQALIATFHTGQDVANACPALLTTVKSIPAGAATLRDIANYKFSDSYSECVDWEYGTRWECYGNEWHEHCRPVHYSYCAQWETHTTHDNGYTQAMNLSANLDILFEKMNAMCGTAGAGNTDAALNAAHDISEYLQGTIKPESDEVYALACN